MDAGILAIVGKNIQEAREAKSWARFELADMIGISEKLLEQYELGLRDMGMNRLDHFAKVLGVSVVLLLT